MIRHIFFDLYGTLVNITTDEGAPETSVNFAGWVERQFGGQAGGRERGHPLVNDLRAIRPLPRAHSEPDIGPVVHAHMQMVLGREPSATEVAAAAQAFRQASRRELELIPGTLEALATLGRRYSVGLISNAQVLFTLAELEELGLSGLFNPQVISSEMGVRKPSGEIFARALRLAGVKPHQALHVGNDPVEDAQAAAEAGLYTCLVKDARRPASDPPVQPDLRVESVADLPPIMLNEKKVREVFKIS